MAKIPRLEMGIRKSPGGHLLDRPFRRSLVIRRAGQTRTVNVREHVLGFHYLRIVGFFLANARKQIFVCCLREQRQAHHQDDQAESNSASIYHQIGLLKARGDKAAGLYLLSALRSVPGAVATWS